MIKLFTTLVLLATPVASFGNCLNTLNSFYKDSGKQYGYVLSCKLKSTTEQNAMTNLCFSISKWTPLGETHNEYQTFRFSGTSTTPATTSILTDGQDNPSAKYFAINRLGKQTSFSHYKSERNGPGNGLWVETTIVNLRDPKNLTFNVSSYDSNGNIQDLISTSDYSCSREL